MLLKKIFPCLVIAFVIACSDDSSDFLTRPSGGSSSSVESSSSEAELSKVVVGCKTEKKTIASMVNCWMNAMDKRTRP